MPDLLEDETPFYPQAVIELANRMLSADARLRMAALVSAKTARPDADPTDQILIAHYILTGSGEFPTVEEQHQIAVRNMAGDLVYGSPDAMPDVADLAETTPPAPTEGEGWKGNAPS